jgi:hypothetical protein
LAAGFTGGGAGAGTTLSSLCLLDAGSPASPIAARSSSAASSLAAKSKQFTYMEIFRHYFAFLQTNSVSSNSTVFLTSGK